jgi:hypothetical protein
MMHCSIIVMRPGLAGKAIATFALAMAASIHDGLRIDP